MDGSQLRLEKRGNERPAVWVAGVGFNVGLAYSYFT